jgi:hypothetical protein
MSKQISIQLSLAISGREKEARIQASNAQAKFEAAGYRVYNPFELCKNIPLRNDDLYWWLCVDKCCVNIIYNNVDIIVSLPTSSARPFETMTAREPHSYGMDTEYNVISRRRYVAQWFNDKCLHINPNSEVTMKQLSEIASMLKDERDLI